MSDLAQIARAARELATELDCIGTTQYDNIGRAFRHFADFVDGREAPEQGSNRRDRAREAVEGVVKKYGWVISTHVDWSEVVDEIIDAVDLA